MAYSPERKAAVLKRMLSPHNMAIGQLSQEEGISEGTLYNWRAEARGKGHLSPDADAGPEGWSSRDKFAAVLETAALNEADLAEYCRKRGLYPAQIAAWRTACERANDWDRASTARLGQATKVLTTVMRVLQSDPVEGLAGNLGFGCGPEVMEVAPQVRPTGRLVQTPDAIR